MHKWLQRLRRNSYRRSFVVQVCLGILVLGVLGGVFFPGEKSPLQKELMALDWDELSLPTELTESARDVSADFEKALNEAKGDFYEQLEMIASFFNGAERAVQADCLMVWERFAETAEENTVGRALAENLSVKQEGPVGTLLEMSDAEPLPRYAGYALATFWYAKGKYRTAADFYILESEGYDADVARKKVVELLLWQRDFERLQELSQLKEYAPHFEGKRARIEYELALKERDILGILRWQLPLQYSYFEVNYVVMALVAGLAWWIFLLQLGQASLRSLKTLMCLLAVLAGALSTQLTVLVITLQEELLGLTEQSDLIGGLLYFIAGVGLREEGLKLLCVVPFLPYLLKQKDSLTVLLVAGCVGLGFAAAENVFYFTSSDGISAPGRFLTANFLHVAATGLCGFGLYRACCNWPNGLNEGITLFGMVVVMHGAYDALIVLPDLETFGFLHITVYALLCYQFFGLAHGVRSARMEPVSLTFNFCVGLSVVLAMTLGHLVSQLGISLALTFLFPTLIGLAIIIIMFIQQMNELMET